MLAEGPTGGAPTSRRELAKRDRRARIVKATHDLLREVGFDDLSMRTVALRAGVSLSTVYNLFASKQAILARVFDEDLAQYAAMVAAADAGDALDRIFVALELAADLYEADPAFYRATMWRRPSEGDRELQSTLRQPRIRFWRAMVAAAAQEGALRREADPTVVGALLIQVFGGVLADWIAGEIPVATLRLEVRLGFAAALLPFADRTAARRLRAIVDETHARLSGRRGETAPALF